MKLPSKPLSFSSLLILLFFFSELEAIKDQKTNLAKEIVKSESYLAATKEDCIKREQQLNERLEQLEMEFDIKYDEFVSSAIFIGLLYMNY